MVERGRHSKIDSLPLEAKDAIMKHHLMGYSNHRVAELVNDEFGTDLNNQNVFGFLRRDDVHVLKERVINKINTQIIQDFNIPDKIKKYASEIDEGIENSNGREKIQWVKLGIEMIKVNAQLQNQLVKKDIKQPSTVHQFIKTLVQDKRQITINKEDKEDLDDIAEAIVINEVD